MIAVSLASGEPVATPAGCVLAGGYPTFLGAAAEQVAAKDWRSYTQTDVVFATQPVEEAKALAKKARVLALSSASVAVATKTAEWALLTAGTWKKIGAGKCATGIRDTTQPLIAVNDATVVELEEDQSALLIFESGISRHRYA